jgi:hypothetical protein
MIWEGRRGKASKGERGGWTCLYYITESIDSVDF